MSFCLRNRSYSKWLKNAVKPRFFYLILLDKKNIQYIYAVNHISCNAIEKVPEHTDNTSCLMIFKLKVIFQRSPVGFNDASVLDMITFKAAHKSVHIFSWSSFKFDFLFFHLFQNIFFL